MARLRWNSASIGVGSNLDDPARRVRDALAAIAGLDETRLMAASALYRNPPMGPVEQPDFVNAVAVVVTRLEPRALLDALQGIERRQGRVRDGTRWGPRTIDLDILTFGERRVDEPGLVIPHPGISERNFVLLPLLEIAPYLPVPGAGRVLDMVGGVERESLERIPA